MGYGSGASTARGLGWGSAPPAAREASRRSREEKDRRNSQASIHPWQMHSPVSYLSCSTLIELWLLSRSKYHPESPSKMSKTEYGDTHNWFENWQYNAKQNVVRKSTGFCAYWLVCMLLNLYAASILFLFFVFLNIFSLSEILFKKLSASPGRWVVLMWGCMWPLCALSYSAPMRRLRVAPIAVAAWWAFHTMFNFNRNFCPLSSSEPYDG